MIQLIAAILFTLSTSMASAEVLLGAWTAPGSEQAVKEFEARIRAPLSIVHRFYAWRDSLPSAREKEDAKRGRLSLVTWEPHHISLNDIINGRHDRHILKNARQFKKFEKRILLRFAHEMNGNWYSWAGNPETYKAAYQRIVNLFRQAGANNVEWVWCPNVMSVPNELWNDMDQYYPGDHYVDWIATDGYNWGTLESYFRWQSFEEIFSAFHERYGGKKPLMIAETSSTETGGNKADWIKDLSSALPRFPHLKAIIWFQENKETDWRVNSSGRALEAFSELVNTLPKKKGP